MRTKLFLESTQNQRCFNVEFYRWINVDKLNQRVYHVDRRRHVLSTCINVESTLSVCWELFFKKGVLRHFAKFTGKHLCQSTFFNKVAGLRPTVSNSKKYLLSNAMSRRAKQQGLTSSLNFMNLKKFSEIAFGFFGDWWFLSVWGMNLISKLIVRHDWKLGLIKPATLLKIVSGTGIFMWILQNS